MVDQIIGKISGLGLSASSGIKSTVADTQFNFLSTLQDVFEKQKEKLMSIPGMPGIYSSNPQTLALLNITDISKEIV